MLLFFAGLTGTIKKIGVELLSKFKEKLKNIGPGALVAAAFIGPGTVTTCTLSGAKYGYTLLWAMLFSTIATIVFQEMAGRLGVVTQKGLGENIRSFFKSKVALVLVAILIIAAIFIGNVAYETGNVTGGAMGIGTFADTSSMGWLVPVLIGAAAFALMFSGGYKGVEKVLIALVILMSVVFIVTSIAVKPDYGQVFRSMFTPSIPNEENAWITVVGLIGTTVVPYNIFLHASSTAKKWHSNENVKTMRWDTIIAVGLGGIISMAIIITAAATIGTTNSDMQIKTGADMAMALDPILGSWAKWFFGIGLFAAGFTSAITAPLSAAFATSGILGWGDDMKNWRFRVIWIIVLVFGITLAAAGMSSSPTEIIIFAQAANAIILPIIAIFLMVMLNRKDVLGQYRNKPLSNILGVIVLLVTIFISARSFVTLAQSLAKILCVG